MRGRQWVWSLINFLKVEAERKGISELRWGPTGN
jgi:hypothetical protein